MKIPAAKIHHLEEDKKELLKQAQGWVCRVDGDLMKWRAGKK